MKRVLLSLMLAFALAVAPRAFAQETKTADPARIEGMKAKMGAPTFDDAVSRIIDRAEQGGTEDL